MTLRGRFAYYATLRVAILAVSAHLRRQANASDEDGRPDPVMLTLWALSIPALAAYWVAVGWWLASGRGPGAKLIALEVVATGQSGGLGARMEVIAEYVLEAIAALWDRVRGRRRRRRER